MKKKNILVTGCAGFIGFHVCKLILSNNVKCFGIDNINNYYDPKLKRKRLAELKENKKFFFFKTDLRNKKKLFDIIKKNKIDHIIHLAAQAGVRYSIKNPYEYLENNVFVFLNILESCRYFKVKHLVYASTSSVYGEEKRHPLKEKYDNTKPIQFYAATKVSNEVMAYSYSHLFNFSTTGLRFFTVYGPWGRPDMAFYKFTESIYKKKKIDVFNYGNHFRDFSYVEYIADAIVKSLTKSKALKTGNEIYNLGNGNKVHLLRAIELIEKFTGLKAIKNNLPKQPGDIKGTLADIKKAKKDLNLKSNFNIQKGIFNFINWYKKYNKIKD